MYSNVNYTKHNNHISRSVHFVRNCDKYRIHKIDWFEGDMELADIATNNFGENDLNPIMKYIMVRLVN